MKSPVDTESYAPRVDRIVASGLHRLLVVPFGAKGVILVNNHVSTEPDDLSADHAWLRVVGEIISNGVTSTRERREAIQAEAANAALAQVSNKVSRSLDQRELGHVVSRIAIEMTQGDKAVVYGMDESFPLLHALASDSEEPILSVPIPLQERELSPNRRRGSLMPTRTQSSQGVLSASGSRAPSPGAEEGPTDEAAVWESMAAAAHSVFQASSPNSLSPIHSPKKLRSAPVSSAPAPEPGQKKDVVEAKVSYGLCAIVASSKQSYYTDSAWEDPNYNETADHALGYHPTRVLTCPILHPAGPHLPVLGVLQVSRTEESFNERELDLLKGLCATAAHSMLNGARHASVISAVEVTTNLLVVSRQMMARLADPYGRGLWSTGQGQLPLAHLEAALSILGIRYLS